jgi:hypothetical protein
MVLCAPHLPWGSAAPPKGKQKGPLYASLDMHDDALRERCTGGACDND